LKDSAVSIATDNAWRKALRVRFPKRVSESLDGYEFVRTENAHYLSQKEHLEILDHIRIKRQSGPLLYGRSRVSPDVSRGATVRLSFPEIADGKYMLRRSVRGGILGKLIGRTFTGIRTRMFCETALTAYAARMGIPVADIIIASKEPIKPFLYHGWVLTKEIPDSQNLSSYLNSQPQTLSFEKNKEKRTVLASLAKCIARMHDSGIYHGDLHIGNILVQIPPGEDPRIYLIDFDKSKVVERMSLPKKIKNLMRLYRSVVKRPNLLKKLNYNDIQRFLYAYFGGDRLKRREAERLLKKYFHIIQIHSLWWRISGRYHKEDLPQCSGKSGVSKTRAIKNLIPFFKWEEAE
jgi:tRNA A-37 threonylcarbamoyl transferase component Bud32